ncbi:metallopeptidase family M12B Reprolysin-like protein [Leptospira ryugenii]|uniref:Metallopeptidase family M12B Reprolysin-like protein n=1 Tax=Leptospira ryugenii TaxID=1917863 RepID=A0A2P2DVA2_9LEPT|nr:metallopeptidase family M12B Reprolysin-like protein [Leptospira ryugenii]
MNQPHSVTASNGVVFNYLILNSNYFFSRDGVGTTTYSGMYPYGRNNTEYLGSSAPSFSPDSSNFFSIEINTGVSLSSTNASYSIVQNCNPSLDEERTFTSSAGSDNTSGLGKVWTYRKKLKVRLIFISGTYDTPTEAGIQTAVNRMKSIYAQDSVKIDLEFTATTVTNSEFQTLANLSDDTGNVTGSLTKMYVSTAAAQSADSLNIYFTANNSQTAGVLGISAGIPGVPGITGTKKSGMVVFIEPHRSSGAAGSSLSTTDQTFMGDTMAHEAGHFLGLFHTNERGGFNSSSSNALNRRDTLTDTPYCLSTRDVNSNGTVDINECSGTGFTNSGASNLMFWAGDGVTAQTQLTGEQGWILRRFPIVY